ncbi:hypothetical protein F2Q70_00017383 [Brassica cretica]|uniref:Uncharacterized protein n=1 Tax=Brassica cretica TaxID=69181 RepID=A0A8S9HV87_BRACR|nr:hypothetical protein F2Q70_00017383 [Brassica cretica]
MALNIFKETPEGHAKENEDNDENLGTYDEQELHRRVRCLAMDGDLPSVRLSPSLDTR